MSRITVQEQSPNRRSVNSKKQDEKGIHYNFVDDSLKRFFKKGETYITDEEMTRRKRYHFLKNKLFEVKLSWMVE